ncbi:MAG: biotin-dependent carboxyltransferase family protein [Ignavibacteria bacterium]|nr:biotin-dependent carboxyltransferase family protein [Ignavibacteria bacterium]
MNAITVSSPGFLTTIQDLGRFGHAHLGVSQAGAADTIALRMGNLLLGNPENTPALEMTLVGGAFTFSSDCPIAITGANFSPIIDGHSVPLWTTVEIKAGQTVAFGAAKAGVRAYLCIRGELNVPRHLGSASTHVLSGIGGLSGRALQKGDELSYAPLDPIPYHLYRVVSASVLRELGPRTNLRVTPASEWESFTDEALGLFYSSSYEISEESNRVGLRLRGPTLKRTVQTDILTEGVSTGTIQVPPNGQPIILSIEHPTTGGYPRIASVISADLSSIGQLRPRDEITFELVDLTAAQDARRAQEALIGHRSLIAL